MFDIRRQRGAEIFETAVASLAQQADEIDAVWFRYQQSCEGQNTVGVSSSSRGWFSIWDNRQIAVANETLPTCRGWLADTVRLSGAVKAGMRLAEDTARRAGVYPGMRRSIRARYRMSWLGWDR